MSRSSYTANWSDYVKNIKSWHFDKVLTSSALEEIKKLTQVKEGFTKNEMDSLTNLYKTLTRIPTDSIFTEEDFEHLIEQAKNPKKATWKQKYLANVIVSSKKNADIKMSTPIFSKDKSKALVYAESRHGGDIYLFIKENDGWSFKGFSMAWIE